MPRPPKLTPEVADRIVGAVTVGAPLDLAAAAGGVNERTLRRWLDRGAKSKKGEYAAFSKSIREAQGRLMTRLLAVVDKAALSGDWRAASWKLGHVFPVQFGGTNHVELTGKGGKPIQVQQESKVVGNPDPVQHAAEILRVLKEVGVFDEALEPEPPAKEEPDDGSDPARN